MGIAATFILGFVIGAGLGYALGWNASAHPGKLEDQASSWWASIKSKFHKS